MEPKSTGPNLTPATKKLSLRVLDGQTELAEEELQKLSDFFDAWSKEILTVIAILAIGYFGYKFYRDADLRQRRTNAQSYEEVRTTFGEFEVAAASVAKAKGEDVKKEQEKLSTVRSRLDEQIKVLGDAKEPYKSLATLYRALEAQVSGDVEAAKSMISSLNLSQKLSAKNPSNLYLELTAIALGRALLNNDSTAKEGWDLLVTVASKGEYQDIPAAKSLKMAALSDDERATAQKIIDEIIAKKPESAELLRD